MRVKVTEVKTWTEDTPILRFVGKPNVPFEQQYRKSTNKEVSLKTFSHSSGEFYTADIILRFKDIDPTENVFVEGQLYDLELNLKVPL